MGMGGTLQKRFYFIFNIIIGIIIIVHKLLKMVENGFWSCYRNLKDIETHIDKIWGERSEPSGTWRPGDINNTETNSWSAQ